ncbi:uncharacterized protein IUM83_01060 [Phytophthora cinnamomi]|uniref:uncharacterized protein n=1 Tax=Phytophthora cinnamomi TaxID=4785 RepID=UPI00355983DB|nr:hypothetical protein IUM83_01060 [Phytophthora cinnamomi]
MDQLTDLLNDENVSLAEVIEIIDSYDFDVTAQDPCQETSTPSALEFLDSIELEGSLTPSFALNHDPQKELVPTVAAQVSGTAEDIGAGAPVDLILPEYVERGRVRERVTRLRGVVKQLEHQLHVLRGLDYQGPLEAEGGAETKLDKGTKAVPSHTSSSLTSGDVVVWRDLALRQYAERRKAEAENTNLRVRLEEQLRVAKRFERLVRGQLLGKSEL